MRRFDLEQHQFRPYSLRRGGATWLFQLSGSMGQALLKGRWSSTRVAKIYMSDALSYLPSLTFTDRAKKLLATWSPFSTRWHESSEGPWKGDQSRQWSERISLLQKALCQSHRKRMKKEWPETHICIYIYISVVGWVINQNRLGGPSCHFITGSQIVLVIFPQYVSYPFNSQSIYSIIFLGTPWYQIDILVPSH